MGWRLQDGRVISTPQDFVDINGIHRSRNIFTEWTIAELAGINVIPFREANKPDEYHRIASSSDEIVNGELVRTYILDDAYTVEELKIILIDRAKNVANTTLKITDWYVIRASDPSDSTAIPQNIQDERATIRIACNTAETTINACTTYQELLDYINISE